MGNVLLTDVCNRNCPYCFARGTVQLDTGCDAPEAKHLSLDDLERVMDFFDASHDGGFHMLGGEPTQHPHFRELVTRVLGRGFQVLLFTNAIMDHETRAFIAQQDAALKVLVNVNHPATWSAAERESVPRFLADTGERTMLGFNIHETEFEADFLLEFIERHGLTRRIRTGLACPVVGSESSFISHEDYPGVGRRLLAFAESAFAADVVVGLDCGFPICMWNAEELGRLHFLNVEVTSHCDVIMDIGPDLQVWPCFPLSQVFRADLSDFATMKEMREHFQSLTAPYKSFGGQPACLGCRNLKRSCGGGCLAHTVASFRRQEKAN